ncbi:MAG: hypothetical protein Q8R29_03990, partial [bacterium]|nr:hypothetical protein [bacterium]
GRAVLLNFYILAYSAFSLSQARHDKPFSKYAANHGEVCTSASNCTGTEHTADKGEDSSHGAILFFSKSY